MPDYLHLSLIFVVVCTVQLSTKQSKSGTSKAPPHFKDENFVTISMCKQVKNQ